MLELIKTLKDTPVPTILTVAGIAFLLLGIAGGVVGKIQVARERQHISLAVGIVLLVLGIAIYVLPVKIVPPYPPVDGPPRRWGQTAGTFRSNASLSPSEVIPRGMVGP